jgi:hypothetical protein
MDASQGRLQADDPQPPVQTSSVSGKNIWGWTLHLKRSYGQDSLPVCDYTESSGLAWPLDSSKSATVS